MSLGVSKVLFSSERTAPFYAPRTAPDAFRSTDFPLSPLDSARSLPIPGQNWVRISSQVVFNAGISFSRGSPAQTRKNRFVRGIAGHRSHRALQSVFHSRTKPAELKRAAKTIFARHGQNPAYIFLPFKIFAAVYAFCPSEFTARFSFRPLREHQQPGYCRADPWSQRFRRRSHSRCLL